MGDSTQSILITGATGYVGGRLLSTLHGDGHRIRAMARTPSDLVSRVAPDVEVVRGDVLEPDSLAAALEGIDVAYYLVHSMGDDDDFETTDKVAALNFGRAALQAGVGRIVYLGGLGEGPDLSAHLRSRQEVGRILRTSGVDTVELRASVIIGSGSLSYELIRSLVERLPIMITPAWVQTETQPIAVEDVIAYLAETAIQPLTGSHVIEIGGADRVTYGELMEGVRAPAGASSLDDPRTLPHPTPLQSLARARDPRVCACRAQADRWAQEPDDRAQP